MKYVLSINDHRWNTELQAVTREPERRKEVCEGVSSGQTFHHRRTQRMLQSRGNDDGRTDERLPYESAELRAISYDHDDFIPAIDGGKASATTKAKQLGAVRMPVHVAHCKRELPEAVFGKSSAPGMTRKSRRNMPGIFAVEFCMVTCGGGQRREGR